MEAKITKIEAKVGEKALKLTYDEAFGLWQELNKLFKASETVTYIPYYPSCPCPKEPYPYEYPTTTWGSGGITT